MYVPQIPKDKALDGVKLFVLDMDGTVYISDGLIDGSLDFIRQRRGVKIRVTFVREGQETKMVAEGNGTLSAVSNALADFTGEQYTLQVFTQHSMQGEGSRSTAASYIGLERADGRMFWGAGTDTDVIRANTNALMSAFANMMRGGC